MSDQKTRHVIGISGGKDSAALAIYLKDSVPEMEYFFCDTQKELPETYEFLVRLESYLGKEIVRLNAKRGFDHWLKIFNGYLPSSRNRWCTRQLKLKPFEDWIGDSDVVSYVAIRADEDREGYISHRPNIQAKFPFKEAGIIKEDVYRILDESGVGLPKYYSWRTRSGCYFCFFQRKIEWLGLKDKHPDLFELAKAYEKPNADGSGYFWSENEPLTTLETEERMTEIRRKHNQAIMREKSKCTKSRLVDVFYQVIEDERDDEPCLICTL